MRALLAAYGAELRRIRSDPAAFSTLVLAVLVYALLYPQPYLNEAIRDVPVIVVDQDETAASRELIRRIDAGEGAAVVATATDMPAAREAFFARRVSAIVIVPPFFERDLLAGRQSPIAAYGDGGYFLVYRAAIGAVGGAARSLGVAVATRRLVAQGTDPALAAAWVDPLPTTQVPLFNPEGGYASYVVPAALVLILQQTLLMGIGLLGAGRRGAPTDGAPIVAALAGKVLAYVSLYLVWLLFYCVILPWAYGLPRLGALADLVALGLLFLLATSLLGATIASLAPSRESVILLLVVLGLPLFFLSGISWPAEALPQPVQWAALLIPSSSAIRALVRVNEMGASLAEVRMEIATLLVLSVLYAMTGLLALSRARRGGPTPAPADAERPSAAC